MEATEVAALNGIFTATQLVARPPLLISHLPKSHTTYGIDIKTICKETPTEREQSQCCFHGAEDADTWYQVTNRDGHGWVNKLRFNESLWELPAYFPAAVTAVCGLQDYLVVALGNSQLHFLDAEFGFPALPPFCLDSPAGVIKSFGPELLSCLTFDGGFSLWQLHEATLYVVYQLRYPSKVDGTEDIRITHEIEGYRISPIIQNDAQSIRWSPAHNAWVSLDRRLPPMFTRRHLYETTEELENEMSEALLLSKPERFVASFKELIRVFLEGPGTKRAVCLMKEMRNRIQQSEFYSQCNIRLLFEEMMTMIREKDPSLLDEIGPLQNEDIEVSEPPSVQNIASNQENDEPSVMDKPEEMVPEVEQKEEVFLEEETPVIKKEEPKEITTNTEECGSPTMTSQKISGVRETESSSLPESSQSEDAVKKKSGPMDRFLQPKKNVQKKG